MDKAMIRFGKSAWLVTSVLLGFLLFAGQVVHAAQIVVDANCSLNNAIRSANQNEPIGGCTAGDESGTDIIIIRGTYELNGNPITVSSQVMVIGVNTATLDGRGRYYFFRVGDGGDLRVQDVPMTNGRGSSSRAQIYLSSGASLSLSDSPITDCWGTLAIVVSENASLNADSGSTVCGEQAVIVAPRNSSGGKRRVAKIVNRPPTYTCETLPPEIVVRSEAGLRQGVQCQVLTESSVGIQSIIDLGIIAAVDIWGEVGSGVEFCVVGQGSMVFMDAAGVPRTAAPLDSLQQGGMTCASITRAGSLVLLIDGQAYPVADTAVRALRKCQVRTSDYLFFRNAPAGNDKLALFPVETTLNSDVRTDDWFRVVHSDLIGWISADYVETTGTCE